MDAVIKISSSEFNEELFKRIRELLEGNDADVTIAVKAKNTTSFRTETEDEFWLRLNNSLHDIKEGKSVTFNMKELEEFVSK